MPKPRCKKCGADGNCYCVVDAIGKVFTVIYKFFCHICGNIETDTKSSHSLYPNAEAGWCPFCNTYYTNHALPPHHVVCQLGE